MIVTADRGYYSSKELKKCIEDKIETIIPSRATAKTKKIKNAKFSKNQFIYNHEEDCYICPNKQILKKIKKSIREIEECWMFIEYHSDTYGKITP